jgi:hypothetical protein
MDVASPRTDPGVAVLFGSDGELARLEGRSGVTRSLGFMDAPSGSGNS